MKYHSTSSTSVRKCDNLHSVLEDINDEFEGIIVLGQPRAIQSGRTHDFNNKDIVVIQAKHNRLGTYLMWQVFFSSEIMKRYNPRSTKAVAICGKTTLKWKSYVSFTQ